ncbi:hypothetical protein FB451DRAFT_1172980 [Mycena latifolia]|nr:hypothetical protein FB451DRAFT_1172980 [Mycena latifolia]
MAGFLASLSTSVLGVMKLCEFCRRFLSRLGRIFSGTKATDGADCPSHFRESSNPGDIDDRIGKPNGLHTARNALTVTLRTLSSVSKNIPFGSILSSVIDPLLDITNRIEQVSSNAEALIALSARIDLLTPIVSEMTEDKAERGRAIVEALQRELESITKDLKEARAQGKLEQFFNSTDNASSLTQHNMALAQIIADSTLATVHEVLTSVRNLERSKFSESSVPQRQVEMGDIRGGFGGTGGGGRIGGEGGEGEGPDLEMSLDEHWKVGAISGTRIQLFTSETCINSVSMHLYWRNAENEWDNYHNSATRSTLSFSGHRFLGIDEHLERWERLHPTLEARKQIIQITIGSITITGYGPGESVYERCHRVGAV